MREKGLSDAAELRSEAAAGTLTETEIIHREISAPAFDPAKDYPAWPVGSPVTDGGQVWLLIQPHNAASHEGRPAALRALWGLAHTKDPVKAKPYVAPFGTSGLYQKDECCLWTDGSVYVSRIDDNAYDPEAYPEGWRLAE